MLQKRQEKQVGFAFLPNYLIVILFASKYIASTYSLNLLDALNNVIESAKPIINFNFKSLSFLTSNGFNVNEVFIVNNCFYLLITKHF